MKRNKTRHTKNRAYYGSGVRLPNNGRRVGILNADNDWSIAVEDGEYEVKVLSDDVIAQLKQHRVQIVDGESRTITVTTQPTLKIVGPDVSHLLPAPAVPTTVSSGRFVDSGQRLGNAFGEQVRLGDLDGDGDLDAFVATGKGTPNLVWLNDGTGHFADSGQKLGSDTTTGVCIGDVDNDGDLDVIDSCDRRTLLWLNDGNAQFSSSDESFPPGRHSEFGDIDGDGDLDILVARYDQAGHVLWNDGQGHFIESGQRLGSGKLVCAAIADLDGDSDLDVYLGADLGTQDSVYLNDGTGRLELTAQTLSLGITRAVELVDWNGDGHLDALLGIMLGSLEYWANDGTGTLALAGRGCSWLPHDGFTSGDVDGDGDPDLMAVVGYGPRAPVCLLVNDAAAGFERPLQCFAGQYGGWPALGDLDGDGDLDAFLTSFYDEGPAQVWWNTGVDAPEDPPLFVLSSNTVPGKRNWGSVPADFDGDGDIDLFVPSETSMSRLWRNQDGRFEESGQELNRESVSNASADDLDGDGDLDLFLSSTTGPDLVWLNDGQGNFTDTQQRLGNGHSGFNRLSDLGADGDSDIVVLTDEDKLVVWFNDGNANFSNRLEIPGTPGFCFETGDVDSDGDLDLVVSMNKPSSQVAFFINDGTGHFERRDSSIMTSLWQGVAITDTNKDSHADVILGGALGQSMAICYGDGSGQFVDSEQKLFGMEVLNVAHADLDQDGSVDLVTGAGKGQPNQVLLNDGNGNFRHKQWLGGSHSTSQLADIDGDGDIDIIESDFHRGCHIWLNQTVK